MLRIFKQHYPIRNVFFILIEGMLIFQSVIFSAFIFNSTAGFQLDKLVVGRALLITLLFQTCLYYNELYDLTVIGNYKELLIRLFQSLGASSIIIAMIYYIFREIAIYQDIFVISSIIVIFCIALWRGIYNVVLEQGWFDQKIILIGDSLLARNIYHEIAEKKDCGYRMTVISPENKKLKNNHKRIPVVYCQETYKGLLGIAQKLNVTCIIVSFKNNNKKIPEKELLKCRVNGIKIIDGNTFHEMLTGKLHVHQTNTSWLIFTDGFDKYALHQITKLGLDFILSLFLLIVLSPLIFITAVAIKIESEGPILFSQDRVGKNNKSFRIYKFRSMVSDAEKESGPVWARTNDQRVTRVGKFIRNCRIDELPQLWNVLKGDMSFVGPRPERKFFVDQLEKRIPYYSERAIVKPGITGWAQVNYGYGATVEDAVEKLNYDLYYIKNGSIYMDIFIIFRTVKTVIFKIGAR